MVTKVVFVLDGYSTEPSDLIYVEDPLFQDPKLTSKDNKSIVELKVMQPPQPARALTVKTKCTNSY